MLKNLFKSTLHIKVYKNKFIVKNIETNDEIVLSSHVPFTTTRLLVGHFDIAENLLKGIIQKLYKGNWLTPSPIVLIQPMEMVEGGLSPVEERVLTELAFGAGARKVTVWVGDQLSNQEVIDKINNT